MNHSLDHVLLEVISSSCHVCEVVKVKSELKKLDRALRSVARKLNEARETLSIVPRVWEKIYFITIFFKDRDFEFITLLQKPRAQQRE